MQFYSLTTDTINSREAGCELATRLGERGAPTAVLCYATVNHDQRALLEGMQAGLPADALLVGCSTQGVLALGMLQEEGYVAGAMAFGGNDLTVSAGRVEAVGEDTAAKGRALGRSLGRPQAVVVLYDPLAGGDMDVFFEALYAEVGCPVVGGGAGHAWGPWEQTFQYFGTEVLSGGAVALGLSGPFEVEVGSCHGTTPVGFEMTATRIEGNLLLELDGRPALQVWNELAGHNVADHTAGLAVGVPGPDGSYLIRADFGEDVEREAVILQAGLPGDRVMVFHRSAEGVLDGTRAMALDLLSRLGQRRPLAVLGFECGARTAPFLGSELSLQENLDLQRTLAPEAPWLGMLAWGEVYPFPDRPVFCNYTYPVLVLCS